MKDGNYDGLVDPKLQKDYNSDEMARMIKCAAACVRKVAESRPQMDQVTLRTLFFFLAFELADSKDDSRVPHLLHSCLWLMS